MQMRVSLIPPVSLLMAVRRVLKPLVRLLVAHGVGFPFFANLAKSVFVEVASRGVQGDDEKVTDSRVSLLSGVHRREVKRLRAEAVEPMVPSTVSLGATLVAHWCANPEFQDAQHRPRSLDRLASKGGEQSFEHLVASVSKDIRSRAVLDEWLSLGVARLDEHDRVHLLEPAFVPAQGFDEKAFYFGKGVHDHLAAAAHNLLGEHPPCLDRIAYYDGLSPESAAKLRDLARELSASAMLEVNRRALELQAVDAEREDANTRVTYGAYFLLAQDVQRQGERTS